MSNITDLQKYSEWNPFIKKAQGRTEVGEKLEVLIAPPDGKGMIFKPTVKSIIVNKEFSWLGRFLFSGIFDGEHIFIIEPKDDGCLLIQKENFSGLLAPLLWKGLDNDTRAGFKLMNKSLKGRTENAGI
ncbi:SRPBCC domain-containing protein [Aliiglaciecola sp. 3_MG-2023]|uniref:SRPBCC domain-containing protein n=1 Tax=Aliiglaciecola sp. 3_MG-2023 TaxID=3062644 RepID=UPI0026E30A0D|nr:SRPBCC domain-containing protein [Aliiglaciecola sp. 3_MG-2023]MDO6693905.1 SRPBCC domain-containing protein [Aliiglaciecola sp. 3_MG-2023]